MANKTPKTQQDFESLVSGDVIDHPPYTGLRFVRFRRSKATCVDEATGERVNLFPLKSPVVALVGKSEKDTP